MGRSTCLPLFFAKKKQNHLVNFLLRDSLLIPPLILSGLKYKDSKMARKAGCEFCYLIVPSSTRSPNNPIFKLTNTGNYQAYLYSIYPKYTQSGLIRNDVKSHQCFLFLNFLGFTSGHFLKISYFRVCFVKLKNRCIKSKKNTSLIIIES